MTGPVQLERARRHALAAADVLEREQAAVSIGDLMLDMARNKGESPLFAAGRSPQGVRAAWRDADALAERVSEEKANSTDAVPLGFCAAPGRRDCAIVSWDQLRAVRTMTTQPGQAGGFAVGVTTLPPVDPLWQDSVIGTAGVEILEGLPTGAVLPRFGAGGVTVSIQAANGTAPAAVDPVAGQASITARTAIATVQCSQQLARQAPLVQSYLARLLLRAVRAKFDSLLLQGAGGAEPQGLANLATSTGLQEVSGTSLAWAGILEAQRRVCASGVPDSAVSWVGAPTVRETLAARERASGSGRMLWDDGEIAGMRAIATPDAPASTLFVGGFSSAVLALIGPGIEIRFDPTNDFNKGMVAWQVFAMFDLLFPQPAAFVRIAAIS